MWTLQTFTEGVTVNHRETLYSLCEKAVNLLRKPKPYDLQSEFANPTRITCMQFT